MTSPTVTYDISVDMANMQDYRAQLHGRWAEGQLYGSACQIRGQGAHRVSSAQLQHRRRRDHIQALYQYGVAVALDDGLVVPNITNTDQKSLAEISAELKELSTAARNGTLGMDRMREGTFTITNLGMFGIESFSPIINQPEVAILGVNTMKDEFVIRDGEQSIRPIMKLSLTADHRVVDGAVAQGSYSVLSNFWSCRR